MNPFLLLLVLFPLIVSAIFTIGAFVALISYGVKWDILSALILFGVMTAFLGWMLKRWLSREGSRLRVGWGNGAPVNNIIRRRVTGLFLGCTYLVLMTFGIFIVRPTTWRYWLGSLSFIFAVATIWSALGQLRWARLQSQNEPPVVKDAEVITLSRFVSTYRKTRTVLVSVDIVIALSVISLYYVSNLREYLSFFDILGAIVLLSAIPFSFSVYGLLAERRLEWLRSAHSRGGA